MGRTTIYRSRGFFGRACAVLAAAMALTVGAAQGAYSEAPGFAERVSSDELPPVEERLPENPMVVTPHERVGEYGGTWRTVLAGTGDASWLSRTIGYEHLVRVNPEWTEIVPNIAESFEVNEDATEYTFRLREGMKWSDGAPFTADDIMFWYEAVLMNEELTPSKPGWLTAGGEPVVVEKLDNTTVRFTFAAPQGLFLQQLAHVWGFEPTSTPRHYLERFHPEYNENLDALVAASGLDDWISLFEARNDPWANPERPSFLGWVVTSPLGEGTRMVVERNPYYFKVDTEGNQLPYIDRVVYDIVEEGEVIILKAPNGEIDMDTRHVGGEQNRAVLVDNMERGDYRFVEVVSSDDNRAVIALNMTHKDPVKREVFSNKDFRIGLSHAIDRPEIIDLIYVGQGESKQPAPLPEAPFYNERLAKQYTEFDVALANEHLDRAFPERDAEGFRLGPDGRRITFTVETFSGSGADLLELVRGYWREVGIDAQVRESDRSLVTTRMESNEHDAVMYFGGGGLKDAFLDGRWYLPSYNWESAFAPAWAFWYLRAPGGEEPPEAVREQFRLWDAIRATADEAEQVALMEQVLEIAADQFYAIGIASTVPGIGIVKNNFHNVPDSMPSTGGAYNAPGPTNPEQYFISSSAP